MRWSFVVVIAGALWGVACGDEPTDDQDDGDAGDGGSGVGGASSGGSGAFGGGGSAGATPSGGTSPSGGNATGGVGGSAPAGSGGAAMSGAAGSTGGSGAAPWTCQIAEQNGNCYCGRMPSGPLTECPDNWPCCIKFNGEIDGVVYEYCACEGIESSAECDATAAALFGGERLAGCPP